jgi:hypothetical protein
MLLTYFHKEFSVINLKCYSLKQAILLIILLNCAQITLGQLPDKILITDKSTSGFLDLRVYKYEILRVKSQYQLFQLLKYHDYDRGIDSDSSRLFLGIINSGLIDSLTHELKNKDFSKYKFENFGYTQEWIKPNIDAILKPIKRQRTYWNNAQIDFITSELTDIKNHKKAIDKRVRDDLKRRLSSDPALFKAEFYFGHKTVTLKSTGNLFGFPWFVDRNISFNPAFPKLITRLLPDNNSINQLQFDAINNISYYSAIHIYYNQQWEKKLKELACLEFEKEIQELKDSFNILQIEEYSYGGRYLWPTGQTFRITLKHPELKKQVFLQFFISKQNNTLYPRDSILKNAYKIVRRIQNIHFLMKYLDENPSRKIEISYFDNRTFNDYNIENFNQNPKQWALYDEKEAKDSSIKEYKNLYCGCNFRLDSNYLQKALFFELIDENDNGSIWVLLPDDTPVLWFFQGESAYRYNFHELGTDGKHIQHPCKKFNKSGSFLKE